MEGHTISETDAAARLGLSIDALRDLLTPEWVRPELAQKNGRRWWFTEEGLLSLAQKIAPGAEVSLPDPPKTAQATVYRTALQGIRNPHVIEALLLGDGVSKIVVRVAGQANYKPGMIILVRHLEGATWEHWDDTLRAPSRTPRMPGKM